MDKVFSFTVAKKAVERLGLEQSNQALADHWLALWNNDTPPPRAKLSPAKLKPYLSGMLLFDVVPDKSVIVRLAGTGYRYVLAEDPTGKDWVAATGQSHRATRLRVFSEIARGAILVAHRQISLLSGETFISEEIILPFAQEPSSAVPVMARVNFSHDQFRQVKTLEQVTGEPLDHTMLSLRE